MDGLSFTHLSPLNQGIVDLSKMLPESSPDENRQINPSSDWMPDKDYIGNISDGKSYVTGKAKDKPFDVAEVEREMEKLSVQDRILAENTVLGISHGAITIWEHYQKLLSSSGKYHKKYRDLPEDDKMLEEKFREVDEEIAKILTQNEDSVDNTDIDAYKLARRQNPKYIDNYLFKIDFLRAEHYESDKAARRIIRYLGEKRELFGDEKLTRVIYFKDLGDDVVAYYRCGALQILPETDLHGRRVIFMQGVFNGTSDEEILVAVGDLSREAILYLCFDHKMIFPNHALVCLESYIHCHQTTEKSLFLLRFNFFRNRNRERQSSWCGWDTVESPQAKDEGPKDHGSSTKSVAVLPIQSFSVSCMSKMASH